MTAADLTPEVRAALVERLTALADDELFWVTATRSGRGTPPSSKRT